MEFLGSKNFGYQQIKLDGFKLFQGYSIHENKSLNIILSKILYLSLKSIAYQEIKTLICVALFVFFLFRPLISLDLTLMV